MAINGQRFLKICKASEFVISPHSLVRIQENTGFELTLDEAFSVFCLSEQLTYDDMLFRGYRPGYKRRIKDGIQSWYFLLQNTDQELVAVITEGIYPGEYEWITTYTPNHRTFSNRLWVEQPFMKAA